MIQNKSQKLKEFIQIIDLKAEKESIIYFNMNARFIQTDDLAKNVLNIVNSTLIDSKDVLC
jgi:hypothetical protein